ncbi:MAG: hypothetical protein HKM07_03425 [Chlamydiae bacterium]|nr:hypothetical protein [Chlamydiota bacterium]
MLFKDREDAAKQIAACLEDYKNSDDAVIVAIAKGGLPLATVITKELQISPSVTFVHKIISESHPQVALGAISDTGVVMLNDHLIELLGISPRYIDAQIEAAKVSLESSKEEIAKILPPVDLQNKSVIIVDDGIATGITMKVVIASLVGQGCKKIIVATPVGSLETIRFLEKHVDEVICLHKTQYFHSLDHFYKSFPSIDPEEMIQIVLGFSALTSA